MTVRAPVSQSGLGVCIEKFAVPATTVSACALMFWALLWPAFLNRFYIFNDLGAQNIPLRYLYMEGLRAGRIDLWSPAVFAGFYMHGEGQIGMLHPVHLLLYRFIPFVQAFDLELITIYCALFAGCYLLFQRWGVDRLAASFGAFVFSLAGTNLVDIAHVNEIAVVAHAPWLMIALGNCLRGDRRYRTSWIMVVALLNGSELLLGHPYYYLMSTALQAWYVLYLTGGRIWSRGVMRAAFGTALGALVGAVQLAPTWSVLKASTRASPSFEFLSDGSLRPLDFVQWVNPFFLAYHGFGSVIYAGIGPVLLLAWLCTKKKDPDRRLILFLSALAVLGVFLSLGKYNLLYRFYFHLPVVNLFRFPSRFKLFTDFALAGGSALALNRLRTLPACLPGRRFRWFLAGLFVLSLSTVAIKVLLALMPNDLQLGLGASRNLLAGSVIVCSGIALFWFALRSRSAGLISFWVFAICDMTFYSGTYLGQLRTGDMHYYEREKPPVSAPGPIFARCCDELTLEGYQLADGYAGLEPKTVLPMSDPKYLKLLGVTAIQDLSGEWRVPPWTPLDPIRLARPFYSDHPADAMGHVDLTNTAVVSQRIVVDNSASTPGSGSVRITEHYPGFIHVTARTSGRALCVLAQRFHPGWIARIGDRGLPLLAVDGDLTGFVLPGGNQDVILEFRPADFLLGRNITLAALLFVMAAFGTNLIFSRRTTSNRRPKEI